MRFQWNMGAALISISLLVGVGQAAGELSRDHAYFLRSATRAQVALLDRVEVCNYPDWQDRFDQVVMSFGVRTPYMELSRDDMERIVRLLTDASYELPEGVDDACSTHGDSTILFRGPAGEMTVMLELWCGRVRFRINSSFCRDEMIRLGPARKDVIAMVRSYFPDDADLARPEYSD